MKSLKATNYQKLIQEEIDNLNCPIFIKETQFIVANHLKKKTPDPEDSTGKFYQVFKEEIKLIFSHMLSSRKYKRREYFSTHLFYFILFFYFWLLWAFVAAHGLSLVGVSGGYSSLRCASFLLRWLLLLRSMGSRRVGFSSCGARASVVVAHRL